MFVFVFFWFCFVLLCWVCVCGFCVVVVFCFFYCFFLNYYFFFFCGVLGVGGGKIYLFSHWISLLTLMKRRKENMQWHKLDVLFTAIWRRTYGMVKGWLHEGLRLVFTISNKGCFMCTIPQAGKVIIPLSWLHQLWFDLTLTLHIFIFLFYQRLTSIYMYAYTLTEQQAWSE